MGKSSFKNRIEADFIAHLDATVDLVISHDMPVKVAYDVLTISFMCWNGNTRIFEWAGVPSNLRLSLAQVHKFTKTAIIRLFDNGIPVDWISEYDTSNLYTIVVESPWSLENTGVGDYEYFINAKDETDAILTVLKYGARLGREPKRIRK